MESIPEAKKGVVIIPAHAEAHTIAEVVGEVRAATGWPVVVADDASPDATIAQAREAGAAVLPLAARLGAWGATQTGIRYARRHEYALAVTMDADGQHLGSSIRALVAPILRGEADVVIGACTTRGSLARQLAWRFFRFLTGLGVGDLTSGFRAYNRTALAVLTTRDATLLDYQDIGVLNLIRAAGLRMAEVEVPMQPRAIGKSRVFSSWLAVANYLMKTLILCLSKWDGSWLRRTTEGRK